MTENEAKWEYCRAIDIIKRIKTEETHERYIDRHKAFDLAIQALSEIQQYREIGTVEEIQSMIERLLLARDMCKDYYAIGTIEEFKALKEKSEPKKAILSRKHHEAYCPNCHFVISDGEFYLLDEYVHYCEDCGQAVKGTDWQ